MHVQGRVMKTHWTPILKWEQLKKHRERKREGKSGAAQEKHWAVGILCRLCFVCFLSY